MPTYSIPVQVEWEFELECDSCGGSLTYKEIEKSGTTYYLIEACVKCTEISEQNSYDAGYDSGREDGYKDGAKDGHADGYREGYNDGYETGREDSLT